MAERVSLDWARIGDDDPSAEGADAGAVAAEGRDWDGLNAQLRDVLSRLWASPTVRDDPECRAIFEALLVERGAEALDRAASRLGLRVDALVADRAPPVPPSPNAPALPSPPRPPSLLRSLFKL